ncbi:DUF6164 family protein [Gilvimarinus sp. DA14]|uniref:DUF6164 family protein n=1 Tax=Gilvimarinus sp. DA14 TaxID=2956798 RepID=UPI0020B7DF12|nr:DUF6164 family protein [Gilvimarinus sp. DA14]UTF61328.1 DUF6164 family protein [Gilvimarinus sp. DA14]
MSHLLMRTSGASFDEVAGLIDRLEAEDIECYQTDSGFWRLGVDGLWVRNSADTERAKRVLEEYQAQFRQEAQEQHRALHARGEAPSFAGQLWRHPVKVILALAAVAAILAISLLPFMRGL